MRIPPHDFRGVVGGDVLLLSKTFRTKVFSGHVQHGRRTTFAHSDTTAVALYLTCSILLAGQPVGELDVSAHSLETS